MSRAVRTPSVLVVEDNPAMRALIRSLVEGVSASIHECANGESALDAYRQTRPDCVLMDIKMGGMGGIAATRAIRRLDPGARIIIVTEHREEEYRRAAADAGASGFVLKENLLDLPALVAATADPPPNVGVHE